MRTVMPPWHVEAVQLYDLDVANRIVGVRGECELGAAFAADSKYVFRLSHGDDCVVLAALLSAAGVALMLQLAPDAVPGPNPHQSQNME